MTLRLALAFTLILFFSIASADWIRTSGPQGGTIRAVAAGSSASLAVTYWGQVFRDNSGAWVPVGTVSATSLMSVGNSFLAATTTGIFRSGDNGSSWVPLFSTTSFSPLMTVDRGIAYVSVNDTIYKSTDGGEHWTFAGYENGFTTSIAVRGDTILIGSFIAGGMQRSTDGGISFTTVTSGFPFSNGTVNSIGHNGSDFFASIAQNGMYRSTDGGFSWELRSTGLPQFDVTSYYAVNRMFTLGTNLYAIANTKVYKYNGSEWNLLPLDYMVFDISGAGGTLLSGTNAGIWRSTNAGLNWQEANAELIATTSNMLAKSGNQVFALAPGRLGRTTNNGDSWVFPGNVNATRLVAHGNSLFAATLNGVSRSTDNGATWTLVNNGITEYLPDLRDLTATADAIYASFFYIISFHGNSNWFSGGVFRSTNNGDSWTPVNNGLPRNTFSAVAPTHRVAAQGTKLFAATVSGIFMSTNEGANWIAAGGGMLPNTWVESLYNSPAYVLFGSNRGVFKFNGSAWEEMNNGLPQVNGYYPYANSFVEANGVLYAGTSVGVFRFDGTSWSPFGTGDPATNTILSITEMNGDLLASVSTKGVWRTSLSPLSVEEGSKTPSEFSLAQNYPNPFNPSTIIRFELPQNSFTTLKVYDVLGQEVATLKSEEMKPGVYNVKWDASNRSSGLYFYQLKAGGISETKRMVLLK